MKQLVGITVVLVMLVVPVAASAQEIGGVAPGSQLQTGIGDLQKTPVGLQGSDATLFKGFDATNLDTSSFRVEATGEPVDQQQSQAQQSSIAGQKSSPNTTIILIIITAIATSIGLFWLVRTRLHQKV